MEILNNKTVALFSREAGMTPVAEQKYGDKHTEGGGRDDSGSAKPQETI